MSHRVIKAPKPRPITSPVELAAVAHGIPSNTLRKRMRRGMTLEQAIAAPKQQGGSTAAFRRAMKIETESKR